MMRRRGGYRGKKWYRRFMACDRAICPHYTPYREPVIRKKDGRRMMLDICGNTFSCRIRWKVMNWIRRVRRW